MKHKMHQMMKQMMNEDEDKFNVRPYSSDNKMDKFEMMKMMKDIMKENQYSESYNKYEMMKMMKKFFGNEHSTDKFEMMEKFFKNDNDMDAFEMMKMMMKFSGEEKNMDMSEMMHSMEKMYGNNYKMTEQDYNKFDNKDNKNFNYAPPQARYRFKRQASESTKPVDYTKPVQGLDKGDRLFAELQEQKKDMEAHVGNMTCVLRETKVLNKENEIDVQSLKKSMEQ